ncbi:alpha/beta hydrolase fold domain-containing protein [Rhodocaloribacter litoris]|uniref:extracellular catalytic domain type 1 short-chain-length polyhydroxyalkanoate depolymerase n=1 Tax=Rhodocaloribacter litoris TaxID=2558931 RepID=UPI00141D9279|nr:PHB depolymerase family esterase [Rhodocaloribacter litoris]QXD14135.1 alpha/beta hydrolase fold domain-containing protein [Rhodocaloribacter litoris]
MKLFAMHPVRVRTSSDRLVLCCNLIALLGAVGCSSYTPVPAPSHRLYDTLMVDGRLRTYLLNLPPSYADSADPYPLVIALHGLGGDAWQFERDYRFTDKATADEFVVAYPEGIPSRGPLRLRMWNAGTCCGEPVEQNVDDVAFISALIGHLVATYRIDPQRVYVAGMSNGGMMAYRLACEVADRIAAVAIVSGTMVVNDCRPAHPMPILHLHSVRDTVVPYKGGEGLGGYVFPSVDSVLTVWGEVNGCAPSPRSITFKDYSLTTWFSCDAGAEIEMYLTEDGGHAWPGGRKPRPRADTPSTAIDANTLIWAFFQRFPPP